MEVVVVIVILALFIYVVRKSNSSSTSHGSLGGVRMSQVLSNWSNAFPFFAMSSDVFYRELECTLKEHDMPNVQIDRANNKEGGLFSSSREYLRIKYRDLVFDVCAAPFGKDFFVSCWMYESESMLRSMLKHTKAGDYLAERAAKRTFYQADQEAMFRGCVNNAVQEVIRKFTEEKGVRILPSMQPVVS